MSFDHTLYEIPQFPMGTAPINNPHGRQYYVAEARKSAPRKRKTPPPQQPTPQVDPREASLTMKDFKTPEQMAAATLVAHYLGETEFVPRTETQLKKAYRKMILKEHPDHGGSPERLQTYLEAFRILMQLF